MIRGAMIIEEGESVEQLDDDDGPNLPNGLSVLHFPLACDSQSRTNATRIYNRHK